MDKISLLLIDETPHIAVLYYSVGLLTQDRLRIIEDTIIGLQYRRHQ